jgi:NTE family protein
MRRIAIGCQGGGSHTAFTAGALSSIIRDQLETGDFEVVALSGTSGGAIGALLAWHGILVDGGQAALDPLERFWQEGFPHGGAARLIPDRLANAAFVNSLRLPVTTGVSPYATERLLGLLPRPAQDQLRLWFDAQTGLRTILEEYVDFDRVPALVARDGGRHELFVGAVEVLTGDFIAFRGTDPAFGVDAVVASGTLPELSRAAVIDSGPYAGVYWDGLYSQNPPISAFFDLGEGRKEDKPDEIWVIRINPRARSAEPQTLRDIIDRRNELAGNQSLEQELDRTRSINRLARAFEETRAALAEDGDGAALERLDASPLAEALRPYKLVALPEPLEMAMSISQRLDYASKFNRDPAFLRMLIEHGQAQARAFLARWRQNEA